MERVSTNLTLFFKFFVPVFWLVFFGAFTVTVLLYDFAYFGNMKASVFRMLVVLFFLSGVGMFAFTLMRLKRVEMGIDKIYITNYFKHFNYPYPSVKRMEVSTFLFLTVARVEFVEGITFGKTITFLASKKRLDDFWEQHPQLKERLLD